MESYELRGHKGKWCRLEHVRGLEQEVEKLKHYRRKYKFTRNLIRILRNIDIKESIEVLKKVRKPDTYDKLLEYTALDFKYKPIEEFK